MRKEHLNWLQENNACKESIRWIKQNNIQSLEEAWNICERGDWLLWMATKLKVDKRKLVLCGALYAHTFVQYMEDPRSRDAVRIAFLWGRGKATDAELVKARTGAWIAALDTFSSNVANDAALAAFWATIAWITLDWTAITDTTDIALVASIVRKICIEDVMKKLK